ncbi:MAG TPA: SDR family NAD(P)-dependent oxidoreductase [Puia sp.]|jgi:NAD(P)-dependent dehydrogenase (short-subunit alcohol dehydrogenase family)|nr:SDR family NAD(P)-dependent oxidoreductase [Puia sp.]
MSRIFITGSADGLGQMAARLLIAEGHKVVLHARNPARAKQAFAASPGAETALAGDLSSIAETKALAKQVNQLGAFDAIIHNAGIGYREGRSIPTVDGLPHVFAVNSLAPYILTCRIHYPGRLVYISSGLHRQGDPSLKDLDWKQRPWNGFQAYADSKLHDVLLAFAFARRWPDVYSNAVEPGWVATKMGGAGAPDSLEEGPITQAWLATSVDLEAMVTGQYFYHKKQRPYLPAAADPEIQDRFLAACAAFSGVELPE